MEDNENKNKHIDDDILRSRNDILRIKKQNKSLPEAPRQAAPSAPDTETSDNNTIPPRILSFEDITARANGTGKNDKPEKTAAPAMGNDDTPAILNDDTIDTGNDETDINNDTAHAFAELLAANPEDGDDEEAEDETHEHTFDETDRNEDHDPLAIIGNAVKMAQLEDHPEDEPSKSDHAPAKPEDTRQQSDIDEIDIIDLDDSNDDDFEQLERELQELGIASEEDDDPLTLQQTPPEPETDKFHEDLLNGDKDKQPEKLTEEERQTLTSDLTEVKELLDQQDDNDVASRQAVPKFDLADQILAEHRKFAAAKRQPPTRRTSSPNIPPASGTVADVIDENKKARIPTPAHTVPGKKQDPKKDSIDTKNDSVNNCSPAVSSIIQNGEELTDFQKQILAELVERDIELHSKESLRKKTQNLRFKKK